MNQPPEDDTFEERKWRDEIRLREKELAIKEREWASREHDLELQRAEQERARWRNPLVVAVFVAAAAAAGNALVALINGWQERAAIELNSGNQNKLEAVKAEASRILEVVRTGDPDKAAENLNFLLMVGLIQNDNIADRLSVYLEGRESGRGVSLPTGAPSPVIGQDDAIPIADLPADHFLQSAARAVGQLTIQFRDGDRTYTAALISSNMGITGGSCFSDAAGNTKPIRATLELNNQTFDVTVPPAQVSFSYDRDEPDFSLFGIEGTVDAPTVLPISLEPPKNGQLLAVVLYRGRGEKLFVVNPQECRVESVESIFFVHLCDTGAGATGAPILSLAGNLVGIHSRRERIGGVAVRADVIVAKAPLLQRVGSLRP